MSQLHGDFLSFCGFQSPHIAHMFASLLQSKAHESFWSLKYLLTWCWTRRCGRTQHNALWYGTELRTASCVILSVTGSIHNFTASHLMKNSAKASAKINKKSASKRINFETVISCVCDVAWATWAPDGNGRNATQHFFVIPFCVCVSTFFYVFIECESGHLVLFIILADSKSCSLVSLSPSISMLLLCMVDTRVCVCLPLCCVLWQNLLGDLSHQCQFNL